MEVTVNGLPQQLAGHADGSLLDFLREGLGLRGAKPGCGEGACGACTVLVNGRPLRACVTPATAAAGAAVTTIEGLARDGRLHPVQEAFLAEAAFQCGYCTGGMILAAAALLERRPESSEAEIAAALEGNICRCCAYPRIVRAVRRASESREPDRPLETATSRELPRPRRPWNLVPVAERDWFEVLGEGLVVVAQRPQTEGVVTSNEAWIHLGADDSVTAFTGKVDVGQGSSDMLAAVVAEELGLAAAEVEIVHGDTDLCPFDLGTFGSRSTPDAAPLLAAAAARAREIRDADGIAGQRLEVVEATTSPKPASRPVGRRAGPAIVTGQLVYPSDLVRPGATLVRPQHEVESERAEPTEAELADWLRAHPAEPEGWPGPVDEREGDVETALDEAALRLDATYETAYIAHAPLETRAAVAEWGGDTLTVWTGGQRPFGVREQLADALKVDEARIRVIAPTGGAAFGGKHHVAAAVQAARLAREAGHAVRVHWTREDEFRHGYLRPAAVIDVRAGLAADGTLAAWDFLNVNSGAAAISNPYRVPASRLRFQPAESPLAQGSYRALAATANTFARESHVDELAELAGADPVEFRLRNLDDERLREVLSAAAERAGWGNDGRSLGIALGFEKGSRVATCAHVEGDRVTRLVTAFDCGAILDRDNLANQVEGATLMGLGGALFERIRFEGTTIHNASLTAYRVPRFSDVPALEIVLLDRPGEPSAGAGETPIVAVAPAIAAALHAATGIRLRSLPLDAETVPAP
ncbi:MAG TPA: molybdopterin cofactor-binding domain-containing protein [Gaiellaceae bacterium]|nr:molybdopterin cofactor-binding domain-containing protein [Gaiellaceae bacterium]